MNSSRFAARWAAVTLLSVVVAGLGIPAADAAGTVSTTGTTRARVPLSSTTSLPGLSVTDPTVTDTLQVTLSTDLGTLALSTTTGLTLDYGYSSFTGTTVSFTGTPANVNLALASATLTSTSTGGTAHVGLSALVSAPGYIYSATNGHFYKYVASANMSWTQARSDAAALSFNGQPGYLATAPTAALNNVLANRIPNANNVWIGAKSTDTPGATTKRTWKWDTGPVAGTVISNCSSFTGACDFTNNTGLYSSWASGEPNNSSASTTAYSGEWVAVTNWSGTQGAWNDLSPTSTGNIAGFIAEFGDLVNGSTGFTGVSTSTSSVLVADAPGVPSGVSATGGDGGATVGFTAPAANGSPISGYTVSATAGGTTTTSSCSVSPCAVTGLTNGVTYSYTVHATNAVGDSAESTTATALAAGAPGAPTGVTATRGNGSASVAFTPGVTGGLTPVTYTATSTPGGLTGTCSTSPCTVSGLTNGTAYTFVVTATNGRGSTPSQASSAVTPATRPGVPSSVSATGGDGGATVGFTAPAANGSPISGYTVSATAGGTTTTSSCSVSPCAVTGLTNGVTYSYTVHATNAVGDSAESTTATALAAGAPGAPTGVTATRGNGSASVAFTPGVTGGLTPVTYTATSTPGGLTGTCSTSPCTVSGLTNGTAYTFVVTATNGRGSTPSQASSAVTPATRPGVPSSVSATGGDGGATVGFTAPAANGSPITGYTVSATAGGTTTTSSCSASPCTVTGLTNGVTYSYTVHATNAVGDSAESTAATAQSAAVPGAPTGVTATRGNGSALVSFIPGLTGGLPVLGYTVTSTPGGLTGSCSASPCTVSGLTNGTSYTFRVAALNALGSTLSLASNAVTPATLPGAPGAVSASTGDGGATVTFTAPAANGSAITGYTVSATAGGTTTTTSCSASPCTVTGLTNGVTYSYTVHATNGVGSSAESGAATALAATSPEAPTAVTATRGNGSALVSFVPGFTGGLPVLGYTATSTPGGLTGTCTLSPCTVGGLINGTSYTFRVAAANNRGSTLSQASNAVTPAMVPDVPSGVSASGRDRGAQVTFVAPAANGTPITGYAVSATAGGVTTTTDCTASPCTVTGLTNGVTYSYTVHATNLVGDSAESGADSALAATVPGAPTGVSAARGNGSATVAFTPGDTGGLPVLGYTATSTPGGLTGTCSVSPCTVSGLSNGTSYTFRVAALNSLGSTLSAASNPVIPASLPAAPTLLSATHGNGMVTLVWTARSGNGAQVTGYTVTTTTGGVTATRSCTSSPCTITGLTNGADYSFVVAAVNAVGTGPVSTGLTTTPATVPDAPGAVTATRGATLAQLSFPRPAFDGGSPVTGYESSLDGQTWAPLATTGTSTLTATVADLTNGTQYDVSVRAVNLEGHSLPSTSGHVTPADVPAAPTSILATRGNGAAVVFFATPADHGSPITSYVVTASNGHSATCTVSPCTITGLTNGTAYTFTVRALNDVGSSAASVASDSVTPVAVPGAPTDLVVGSQDSAATVSFAPPTVTGGSGLTGFESSVDGGQTWSALTTAGSGTLTGLVGGLTNGTAYVVRVRALNIAGAGPEAVGTSIVPAGAPQAVGAPTAVVQGTAATLTWTPPIDDGGAPVTSYVVTTVPSSTTCTTTTLTCTLTGLVIGTEYAFVVRADNAHVGLPATGLGPVATAVARVLPTSPDSPEGLAVAGSDRTLHLTFTRPSGPGTSPVAGYQASTDDGATWSPLATTGTSVLSGTIQPVLNGQTYPVRVRAVSLVGPGTPSTTVQVPVGQWYADPVKAKDRVKEVEVPASPKAYAGRARSTVATYRSALGATLTALVGLRGRQLQAGQGVSIRTKLLFVPTRKTLVLPTAATGATPAAPTARAASSGATATTGSTTTKSSPVRFTKNGRTRLRTLAASLRWVHGLTCEGYTDYSVPAATARRLSTLRAQAVCKALVAYGAPVTVTSRGYGARLPVLVGPAGRARDANNRLAILVTTD